MFVSLRRCTSCVQEGIRLCYDRRVCALTAVCVPPLNALMLYVQPGLIRLALGLFDPNAMPVWGNSFKISLIQLHGPASW
jgi:hypothetical protein